MNINQLIFWGVIILMTFGAVILISWPWLHPKKNNSSNSDKNQNLNIAVYRERLSELDTALDYPTLTLEQREQEKYALMHELLADIDPVNPLAESSPSKNDRWTLFALVLFLPVTSLIIYSQIGNGGNFLVSESNHPALEKQIPPLEEIVNKLAARLRDNPNDAQGWILLARSYNTLENYPQAAAAYARAYALMPEKDPELLIEYAETLVVANNNQISDQARALLNNVLEKIPDHPQALWLNGIWAFQEARYQEAIHSWQHLISILPANSEYHAKIQSVINEAIRRIPKDNAPTLQE